MWMPEVDPPSITTMTLNKIANNPDANMGINMGPILIKFLIDDNGILKIGNMSMGPINMTMKTLYTKGQF